MKNATIKQIEQIKAINVWDKRHFHGNKKKVGLLLVKDLQEIITKKLNRHLLKYNNSLKQSNALMVRNLLKTSIEFKNTPYSKVMIEGNTGIYYASPIYLHQDYNKSRLFDKNEQTLKLMQIFNCLINKQ